MRRYLAGLLGYLTFGQFDLSGQEFWDALAIQYKRALKEYLTFVMVVCFSFFFPEQLKLLLFCHAIFCPPQYFVLG